MNIWNSLGHELVRDWLQQLWFIILGRDDMSSSRTYWESLAWSSFLARCLGLSLPDLVGVDSVKEILPALGVLDVLNTDVDSLGEDLATDTFVHNDSDCSLGHVEDTSSLSVVGLVGHTLLEGTATLNVNNISNLVKLEVC